MPIVRKYMKMLPVHRLQDLPNNQRPEKPTSVIDCHATKFPNPPSFPTQYKIRKRNSFAKKYMSAISEVFQNFYKLANNSDRPSHPTQKQKKKMAAILQRSSASIPFVMGPKDLQWGLLFGATTTAGCCTIFGYAAASLSKIGTSNTSS